ncbi:protein MpTRIHELIX16 [Marchantia polymorpha subsp. ruderalis]|nr:hypothetical protein MARPO_0037s0146 [Marchantia polymorpha]BBN05122.1 hypothetical protein Mp_3g10500 [Marchantia polymorpha subsp. ruderalis]|eukprot:PTQ40982.1 hypothetical protein MARPO_0037s0146 [Marchantia polymorpha]
MEGENGEASDPTQEVATLNLSACPHTPSAFPTPATSDCNGGPGGARTQSNNKKRSRSAPWTVSEMLTLIDAKKEERERCQMYKLQGVKLPAAEKWRIVATHMETKDMGRSGSQCQDKWENMMKDYKAVREWQYIMNPTGKNYFKEMTNKERKDASLPPQMDEVVFYSLHAIQNEKEEKKDKARRKIERDSFKQPNVGNSLPVGTLATKDKVGSSEANDMESMDTDSSGKRRRRKKVGQDKPPIGLENPVVLDDFVHAMKDGSKELVECFMKVLERNERQPSGELDTKTKDTATLAQVLVALADAVKTIAEKL